MSLRVNWLNLAIVATILTVRALLHVQFPTVARTLDALVFGIALAGWFRVLEKRKKDPPPPTAE